MSRLTIYADDTPNNAVVRTEDQHRIAAELSRIGVRFERWDSPISLDADAAPDAVLAAYRPYLDVLMGTANAGSADMITLTPEHPQLGSLRRKFLSEHIHNEAEIRFFVQGSGSFIMHVDGKVWDTNCTAGDLISVPANMPHWFDAGPQPRFTALRVFTDQSGWVPHYTGASIHERFPAS